jgi:hypothetical protein
VGSVVCVSDAAEVTLGASEVSTIHSGLHLLELLLHAAVLLLHGVHVRPGEQKNKRVRGVRLLAT